MYTDAPPVHARQGNMFQLDISFARKAMEYQIGVELHVPVCALKNGAQWRHLVEGETFRARVLGPSYEKNYVLEAVDEFGYMVDLTSAALMHRDTIVCWRPVPALVESVKTVFDRDENRVAQERAAQLFDMCADYEFASSRCADDLVLMLDGNGTNRRAMERASMRYPPHERPTLVTVEMDADVALAQHIMLGNVFFTGADPSFQSRGLLGGHTPGVKVEHIIEKATSCIVSSASTPSSLRTSLVVGAYFDYCGGPVGNMHKDACRDNFKMRVLPRLPRMRAFAVTMSKRQHPNLSDEWERYIETPYGYTLEATCADNAKVECRMYRRDRGVARRLAVPGRWWKDCPPGMKTHRFECVVVDRDEQQDTVRILCPEETDGVLYTMRADAVEKYAIGDDVDFTTLNAGRARRSDMWHCAIKKTKKINPKSRCRTTMRQIGVRGRCNSVSVSVSGATRTVCTVCCNLKNGHIGPHSWESELSGI